MPTGIGIKPGDIRVNVLLGRSQAAAIDLASMGLGSQTFDVTFQAFYAVAKSFMLLLKMVLLFKGYKLEWSKVGSSF